jgi:hypothetical protein
MSEVTSKNYEAAILLAQGLDFEIASLNDLIQTRISTKTRALFGARFSI